MEADVFILDVGDQVICDLCGEDWTNQTGSGGLQFQSKAVCPDCAPAYEAQARKFNEGRFIRARCPDSKSFANWVRTELR